MISRKLLGILAALLAFGTPAAQAKTDSTSLIDVQGGLIAHDAGRFSNSASGETSLLTAMYVDLAISAHFSVGPDWNISPFLGYTPFGYKSADDGEKSHLLPIAVRLQRTFESAFVHLGPGLLIYSVSGSGGTSTLNNGTGTSVFGLPSDSHSSKLVMLDIGGGVSFGRLSLGLDLLVTGLFSSSRRAVSPMLNLGFGVL